MDIVGKPILRQIFVQKVVLTFNTDNVLGNDSIPSRFNVTEAQVLFQRDVGYSTIISEAILQSLVSVYKEVSPAYNAMLSLHEAEKAVAKGKINSTVSHQCVSGSRQQEILQTKSEKGKKRNRKKFFFMHV